MCSDVVERCRAHGYRWIGETKSNRIVIYDGRKYHFKELVDLFRSEGRFSDVLVDGEIYQACKVETFVPSLGNVSIVIDAKADTKDVHLLCTDLTECSAEEIVKHALKRHRIEDFHRGVKFMGLGEYRFRASEAALILTRAPSHPGLYTPQDSRKQTPQIRHRKEAHPIS